MSDSHLRNVRNYLRNRAEQWDAEAQAAYGYSGQGDMACYHADNAGSEAMEQSLICQSMADLMDEEITRRERRWEKWKK
jgi:hypothetical protein